MTRWQWFFHEWARLFFSPVAVTGGWQNVLKTLGLVAGLFGGTAAVLAWVSQPALWLFLPLSFLFVAYSSWTGGMAYLTTKGPTFRIGPIVRVGNGFHIWIKNRHKKAKITIRINSVRTDEGKELLKRSWEGHWVDRVEKFDGNLKPFEETQYCLLTENSTSHRHKDGSLTVDSFRLVINSRDCPQTDEGPRYRHVNLFGLTPIEQQRPIHCEAIAIAESLTDEVGLTVCFRFDIAPDPSAQAKYRLTECSIDKH